MIWEEKFGHGEVFDRFVEVVEGSESLSSSAESLVAEIFLFGVAIIKDLTVFEHAGAVIDYLLPHLETDSGQCTVSVEREHVLDLIEGFRIMMVRTLVKALFHAHIAKVF